MRELRLAVAMNGGVSLAVWIGGVAHELARFSAGRDAWGDAVGDRPVTIDVFAGTSAGGINSAFLAIAERYGVDLGSLRQLWLDDAGLEPRLLRPPRRGARSLLDGDYFHARLRSAFDQLLPAAPSATVATADRKRIDLRLTTTAYRGTFEPLDDDLSGAIFERDHRASFHFVDGAAAASLRPEGDLSYGDGAGRRRLADELARATRSTASFPFAFEPSRCEPGQGDHLQPPSAATDHLVDGGVLDNLPIDEAIEAITAMPAEQPVERWLVAVVPDPSTMPGDTTLATGAGPTVAQIVTASAVGIPNNQTVGRFVKELRVRNAIVTGRTAARQRLLERPADELIASARTVWPSYVASRRVALARELSEELREPTYEQVLAILDRVEQTRPLPHFPTTWEDLDSCWPASVVRRHVALLLQLHAAAGAGPDLRRAIHDLRAYADTMSPRRTAEPPPPGGWEPALLDELAAWPAPPGRDAAEIERRRATLAGLVTAAARLLVRIADGWASARPRLLDDVVTPDDPDGRTLAARRILSAIEVLRGAFGDFEQDPEQVVALGLLTPLRGVALDPLGRTTAREKLAGDELGHFGAFLKRSWRANDWMWGRLDASSFLVAVLGAGDIAAIQATIVREEAPHIVAAVLADRDAGAASPFGTALLGDAELGREVPSWDALRDALGLGTDAPEREFLRRCRIGEEHVADELRTPLVARVGTGAAATSLTVLRAAGLPLRSVLDAVLAPARWLAIAAHHVVRAWQRRSRR